MTLVPLRYTYRSLFVRGSATLLTIFSIAATVAVLAAVLALQQGFANMSVERGSESTAVILRQGAKSEGESGIRRADADIIVKGSEEIATDAQGRPMAASEIYLAVRREKFQGGETNVPIRGVEPMTFAIHGDDVRIVEGENLTFGRDEVIVARRLTDRIPNCRLGDPRPQHDPVSRGGDLRGQGLLRLGDLGRRRADDGSARAARVLARDRAGRVARGALRSQRPPRREQTGHRQAMSEREYLQAQTGALSAVLVGLGTLLALLMGLAAIFTGTNSMLSALSSRTQEIGILLSIGYRGVAIFFAFLLEAILLGLLGGLLGCVLVLPLNFFETGTTNFDTFTETTFRFQTTPFVLTAAVVFAMLLGLVGGTIPAWRASRLRPVEALRRA